MNPVSSVKVQSVVTEEDLHHFLHFPWQIYKNDPCWVPPLINNIKKRLDVSQNPFFQDAERELFLACRDQKIVGTIAAIVNHRHNRLLDERTGFFGFFETVDDPVVAEALISTTADWLKQQGLNLIRGPVNGAPTDEVGLLIAGHQRRPCMWEGHTPPYYQCLIENLGFHKYDDVFAYEITYNQFGRNLNNVSAKLRRVAERGYARPNVRVRQANMDRWEEEITTAHTLYNTAFRSINGHIGMSLEKFATMAASIRPVLDPKLILFVEVDGQAVGFAVALPDINEVLCNFDGRISLWGKIKLRWYLKHIRTACFKLLGILPEFRAYGLEAMLILEMAQQLVKNKYERLELSLASEKNLAINRILRRLGGRIYRQYRIYERPL